MKLPTFAEIDRYISGVRRHTTYKECETLREAMRVHLHKIYPRRLIDERRPAESPQLHAYRKKIYKSKTQSPPQRVLNSLGKIRRSKDWMLKFPPPSNTKIIETLEDYVKLNYPNYGSVEQWLFSELLNTLGMDANAYIAVLPRSFDIPANKYYEPVAMIFPCTHVLRTPDAGDYCVLQSTETVDYGEYNTPGRIFYAITDETIAIYRETISGGKFEITYHPNITGQIPVFKVRAFVKEGKGVSNIQVSRLDPMVESLDEAAREYSDSQGVKVQHANPLFWMVQNDPCIPCEGTGKVIGRVNGKSCDVPCKACNGAGQVIFDPYANLMVRPAKMGEQQVPTPPAGYVLRDVEVMKYLDASVKMHLFDSLASINFQFLDQTPLTVSGDAKNVDREELTNYVYTWAEDLVYMTDRTIYFICEWRYALIEPNPKKRLEMLPEIPVPENFDLLPASYLIDEITRAKTGKVNPVLIAAMEKDFASKKFYSDNTVAEMLAEVYELNPLPGLSDDEKMTRLSNFGITLRDYVVSSNIEQFVKRATVENENFFALPYLEKRKIMYKFADEITEENNAAKQKIQIDVKPKNEAETP
jgi:hypothetical protein